MLDNSMRYKITAVLDYLGNPKDNHMSYVGRIVYRPSCTQNCARLPLLGPRGNVDQTLATSSVFKIVEDECKVIIYTKNSIFVLEKLNSIFSPSKTVEIHIGSTPESVILTGENGVKERLNLVTIVGLFSEHYIFERMNKEQVMKIFPIGDGRYGIQETLFDLNGYTVSVVNDSIYPIYMDFGYLREAAIIQPGTVVERTF